VVPNREKMGKKRKKNLLLKINGSIIAIETTAKNEKKEEMRNDKFVLGNTYRRWRTARDSNSR
jgi:hypothetical protein